MRLVAACLTLVLLTAATAMAQPQREPTPPLHPEDVASLDAIMNAVYESISGPAGPRDWDRFRDLFAPGARLIPVVEPPNGVPRMRMMTPDEYIELAGAQFMQNPFYETEINREVQQYGWIAQVFSTYASFRSDDPNEEPFMRGINSFQLMYDGNRWWVVTIYWNHERPERPIPEQYLPSGR